MEQTHTAGPACCLCGVRRDVDDLGPFFWIPLAPGDEPSIQDTEPARPGDVCCDGGQGQIDAYQAQMAYASGYHD
jgi:hypothetical protein